MAHRSTLTAAPAGIAAAPAPAVAPGRRAIPRPPPGPVADRPLDAVELLVGALARADRARSGRLLAGVAPAEVYDAAVAVVLRLVVAQLAEARGLLPRGDARYDRTLAASTLPGALTGGAGG